ncbi:MAG: hypothetical protein ACOZAN_00095 [Patescibacteria group bacterium]
MFTKIHQPIAVTGVYRRSGFIPRAFLWRDDQYRVEQVTFQTDFKDGDRKKRFYAVESGGNLYRLLFDREDESWFLEEVWCE